LGLFLRANEPRQFQSPFRAISPEKRIAFVHDFAPSFDGLSSRRGGIGIAAERGPLGDIQTRIRTQSVEPTQSLIGVHNRFGS